MLRMIIISITTIFLLGCAGKADLTKDGKKIPFDVTKIEAHIAKNPKNCYIGLKKSLVRRGYSITSSDVDSMSIVTDHLVFDSTNTEVSLRVVVLEGSGNKCTVRLSGKFRPAAAARAGGLNIGDSPIRHGGLDGSILRTAWNELHGFAKSLNPEKIDYR